MAAHPERIACPVAARAADAPDAPALRDATGTYTFARLEGAVRSAAPDATPGGVTPFAAPPTAQHVAALFAILRAGGIALPLNPAFPEAYVEELRAAVGFGPCWTPPECLDFAPAPPWEGDFAADHPAVLVLTSGSTGLPKAALLSLGNLVWNARLSNGNIPLAPGDAWLLSLPLFHVSGLGVVFRCLEAGATVAVPAPGTPLADALAGVTHVSLVAAQLHRLLADPAGAARLRDMKAILLGGSAIPEGLLRAAHAAGLPIHTTYGMTEAASQVTTTPPGADVEALLTSGRPLHAEGLRVEADGTLTVGGPTRFLGYWRHGQLERPFDAAGRFPTGDLGFLDAAGRLVVTGRRDNRFIAGGENIQPEAVERCICRLPGVRRAVVVPLPHAGFGNTPVAFIDGGGLTLETLRAALAEELPDYMVPRHVLPWPEDLAPEGSKLRRGPFIARARETLA